jgi:hypothetical protein
MLIVPRRTVAGAGAIWTPAQISTALWLDAADSSTITPSSGLATQWSDKSGNNRHVTFPSGFRPATGTRTINGLNALDFATSYGTIAAAPLAGTTSAMAVFVCQLDTDPPTVAANTGPVLGDWGTGAGSNHSLWTDGTILEDFMSTTRQNAGNPSPSLSANACIISMVSANSLWQVYVNGTLQFNTTTNAYAINTSPQIGRSINLYFDGRILEIVAVGNNTATTTRQLLEGYMAGPTRSGLQSLLPAGHPFKSAAP